MPAEETFDAGPVFAAHMPTVTHQFRVHNTSGRVVRILSENHSCDCAEVTLDKRQLLPAESARLEMNVRIPPVYSKREVSCVIGTDLPERPDWVYRIQFESFPNARIVPDPIDFGTCPIDSSSNSGKSQKIAVKDV